MATSERYFENLPTGSEEAEEAGEDAAQCTAAAVDLHPARARQEQDSNREINAAASVMHHQQQQQQNCDSEEAEEAS